jgi:prepilin-type processing-associated H-X9-DG protein
MLMYSQDYDEILPAANRWMDLTSPYRKSELSLHCPSAAQSSTDLYGYSYNRGVSGHSLATVADPRTTIMNYDSSNLARNASDPISTLPNPGRHTGGNNTGYVDGHAKYQHAASTQQ